MSLTIEQIIEKEKEYFSSEIAAEPAYIVEEEVWDSIIGDYTGGNDKCVYKTEDGRACAVGCLFLDKPKFYDSEFDSGDGIAITSLPEHVQDYLGQENISFLEKLQQTHDDLAREYSKEHDEHFGKLFLERARDKFPSKFSTV